MISGSRITQVCKTEGVLTTWQGQGIKPVLIGNGSIAGCGKYGHSDERFTGIAVGDGATEGEFCAILSADNACPA